MTSVEVTGRGAELKRLRAALDTVRTGRRLTFLVQGEPGAGKTAVLEALAARAADAGFTVATASPRGLPERPFATAEHLLGHLPTGAGAATEGAEPTSGRLRELVERVREHTRRTPLALILDDALRLDPWSLRWLLTLSASCLPCPLLIVLSARAGGAPQPAAELVAEAEHVLLTGLPVGELAEFAAARCAAVLDAGAAAACEELTGGNPGLLMSLLSGQADRSPSAADLRAAAESGGLPGTERWLGSLSEQAYALARAVAVLGDDAEIAQAAELARLTVPEALDRVDELVGRGLLANRTPLAFRYPLLAAMVTSRIPVGSRTALHLRAAGILHHGHFGVTGVARQLAAAGPSGQSWTVWPLRSAARRLAREGRAEEAARCLRGVLRERLRPRVRAAVHRELAAFEAFGGPDATVRQLDAARRESEDPEIATEYAVALACLLSEHGRPADAVAVLDDTAARLAPADTAQVWRLRLHRSITCSEIPARLVGAREQQGDPAVEEQSALRPGVRAELAALQASHAVNVSLDRAEALRRARQALARDDVQGGCLWRGCVALVRADELTEAWTHTSRVRLADGAPPGRWDDVTAELLRATIHRVSGDLAGAVGALAPMTDLLCRAASASASHTVGTYALAVLIEARAQQGDLDTALALLTDCGLDRDLPQRLDTAAVLAARAVVWEWTGDPRRAVEEHLAAGAVLTACRVRNPAVLPWRSRAAKLLGAAGQVAEAARLATAELEEARRWGTPRSIGVAEHALAMTETGSRRVERLSTASETLSRSPARLELAGARYDLGMALSSAGRPDDAGAVFAAALSAARTCAAWPLAGRITAALKVVSPAGTDALPHPALRGLTPQELKILRLARDGHTNRAIAGRLFVTVRTIEFHLSGAYRKLGITGRKQLAELIPTTMTA